MEHDLETWIQEETIGPVLLPLLSASVRYASFSIPHLHRLACLKADALQILENNAKQAELLEGHLSPAAFNVSIYSQKVKHARARTE